MLGRNPLHMKNLGHSGAHSVYGIPMDGDASTNVGTKRMDDTRSVLTVSIRDLCHPSTVF